MSQPDANEIRKWHQWFAVETNNRAWSLSEQQALTSEETEELLHTAYASLHHWRAVGTDENAALARQLLARVHALRGEAEPATRNARMCLAFFESRSSEPWQLAFSYAVAAAAAAIANDTAGHREFYARAKEIGDTLDTEDKGIFERTFERIPRP